jgi:hypothetical protein
MDNNTLLDQQNLSYKKKLYDLDIELRVHMKQLMKFYISENLRKRILINSTMSEIVRTIQKSNKYRKKLGITSLRTVPSIELIKGNVPLFLDVCDNMYYV